MPASPESQSPTISSKRKKTVAEVDGDEDSAKKKARTRVRSENDSHQHRRELSLSSATRTSFSCGECHRRKQKCDRQFPCSHCVARKVQHKCIPYTPGKPDQGDVHMRLSRLEQIIEIALPQYANADLNGDLPVHDRSISPTPDGENRETIAGILDSLPNGHHKPWIPESTPVPNGATPLFHQISSQIMPASLEEATPNDRLRSLIEECGVSPHKVSEIAQELPPEQLSDVLVQYYFKYINYTRYPIHEPDFRSAYESIRRQWPRVQASDVRFLPLLFVVLATAVRLAPERIAGDARERKLTSLRYYWSARRSMLIAAAVQTDCVELVLAQLLSARFLIFERRITECWSQLGAAVKTAQALSLHRDPAKTKMTPFQIEYHRRIWSYLYHADRTYSLILGRPYCVQDEYTTTQPPSNIEESMFNPDLAPGQELPLTTPTQSTYLILRHKLSYYVGLVVHHFQQVRKPSHYSEVMALDEEICKFTASLPPHFAMEPDTSLDATHEFLVVHRFIIITEIFFVRIALHRPYVLRRLESERYAQSRRICFDQAIKDFQFRHNFKQSVSRDVIASLGWAYREFQSAMISGIALVLDPHSPNAEILHTILDSFLADREGIIESRDPTSRREVRIIRFLKNKALSVRDGQTSVMQIDPALEAKQHADLLLGLQQGGAPGFMPAPMAANNALVAQVPASPFTALSMTPVNGAAMAASSPPFFNALRSPPFHMGSRSDGAGSHNTGSPIDDESAAQRLFDRWCNTMGGDSYGQFTDPVLSGWQSGQEPFSAFVSQPFVMDPEPRPVVSDGEGDGFWESLVSQIRPEANGPVRPTEA
ncbi:hypothetical protein EXIGLDRAFT_828140 [Exidia glandulosa HHB12029]|uniref:Zn(2)-C6 fungal-type domain-containing protein n=1 Tax=Exidia glandulosa HHB12029 TaxID=1314781 RepID=A0A165QY12_EXIGL|nr:hypothetical protein EXIGLDRAFT_828140 [Exidia glandulosa HHB12029]